MSHFEPSNSAGVGRSALKSSAVRFLLGGMATYLTGLGVAMLCHEILGLAQNLAVALAVVSVFLLSFLLMRYYVFERAMSWHAQFLLYSPTAVLLRLSEYGLFLLVHNIGKIDYRIAYGGVIIVSFFVKFFVYRYIFSRPGDKT